MQRGGDSRPLERVLSRTCSVQGSAGRPKQNGLIVEKHNQPSPPVVTPKRIVTTLEQNVSAKPLRAGGQCEWWTTPDVEHQHDYPPRPPTCRRQIGRPCCQTRIGCPRPCNGRHISYCCGPFRLSARRPEKWGTSRGSGYCVSLFTRESRGHQSCEMQSDVFREFSFKCQFNQKCTSNGCIRVLCTYLCPYSEFFRRFSGAWHKCSCQLRLFPPNGSQIAAARMTSPPQ